MAVDNTTEVMSTVREPRETLPPPGRSAARLVCVVGDEVGRSYPIGSALVIGRAHDADVQMMSNDVSRQHARVVREQDDHIIEDLESRNGTTVNGQTVLRQVLRSGDRIQIGDSAIFVFTRTDDLEQRAVRIQKLDALAQLAGGVVHDFRNVLAIVLANAEFLEAAIASPSPDLAEMGRCAGDIRAAADSGVALARRLLYFARRNENAGWSRVEVASMVEEVLGLLRASLRGRTQQISVNVAVDPGCVIRGSREELHHALVNICLNARDAMPAVGSLTIRGRTSSLGRPEALHAHLPDAGTYVEIEIADTGCGMDETTMARIFEPFFSTKPTGQGTGLGLSTAFGVVRNHGGNIFVESAPGKGTTFRVLLPAHPDQVSGEP